jgi:hypothetical protein
MKHKRPGVKRPLMESVSNRFKKDKDPRLTDGVREDFTIDRVRGLKQQEVRNARTGEVIHKEVDEPLSSHRSKNKKSAKK